jgi:hypothetical protein
MALSWRVKAAKKQQPKKDEPHIKSAKNRSSQVILMRHLSHNVREKAVFDDKGPNTALNENGTKIILIFDYLTPSPAPATKKNVAS